jgi:hypothetical protein
MTAVNEGLSARFNKAKNNGWESLFYAWWFGYN